MEDNLAALKQLTLALTEKDDEIKRQAARLRTLNHIIMDANKANTYSDVLRYALDATVRYLQFEKGYAYTIRSDTFHAKLIHSINACHELTQTPISYEIYEHYLSKGEVYCEIITADECNPSFLQGKKVYIPLLNKEKVCGCLLLVSKLDKEISFDEMEILKMIGIYLGNSVQRVISEDIIIRNERKYRKLYEDSPIMNFTVDKSGKVTRSNRVVSQTLGYTFDELYLKPVTTVFHPDDADSIMNQLYSCIESMDEVRKWEGRKIKKNGEVIWVNELACAHYNEKGEVYIHIACEDITSRKISENALKKSNLELSVAYEELRASEEKRTNHIQMLEENKIELIIEKQNFDNLFNSIDDMIVISDNTGKIISINHAVTSKLKYPKEEIIGKQLQEVYNSYCTCNNPEQLDLTAVNRCSIEICNKDGTKVPLESKMVEGIWDDQPVMFIVLHDNSEVVQMFERMRTHEQVVDSIFDNLNGVLLLIDRSLSIVMYNKTLNHLISLFQLPPVRLNQSIFEAFPFLEKEHATDDLKTIFQLGTILHENKIYTWNGKSKEVTIRGCPIYVDKVITYVLIAVCPNLNVHNGWIDGGA